MLDFSLHVSHCNRVNKPGQPFLPCSLETVHFMLVEYSVLNITKQVLVLKVFFKLSYDLYVSSPG